MRIKVSPKAAQNRVGGVVAGSTGTALKVGVTAAPEGGKANDAVIKLLARKWRLPRSRLRIAAGARSRAKVLFVEGEPDALLARLNQWMEEDHD